MFYPCVNLPCFHVPINSTHYILYLRCPVIPLIKRISGNDHSRTVKRRLIGSFVSRTVRKSSTLACFGDTPVTLTRDKTATAATFAIIIANLDPIQFRGPNPNGRQERRLAGRCCSSKNLSGIKRFGSGKFFSSSRMFPIGMNTALPWGAVNLPRSTSLSTLLVIIWRGG